MKNLSIQLDKIFGKSSTPLKYSSAETRSTSLQPFMGDAAGDEKQEGPCFFPYDNRENLELKFKSGANRTDLPSAYGPVSIGRRIADKKTSLASEMFSWIRNRGEPR